MGEAVPVAVPVSVAGGGGEAWDVGVAGGAGDGAGDGVGDSAGAEAKLDVDGGMLLRQNTVARVPTAKLRAPKSTTKRPGMRRGGCERMDGRDRNVIESVSENVVAMLATLLATFATAAFMSGKGAVLHGIAGRTGGPACLAIMLGCGGGADALAPMAWRASSHRSAKTVALGMRSSLSCAIASVQRARTSRGRPDVIRERRGGFDSEMTVRRPGKRCPA